MFVVIMMVENVLSKKERLLRELNDNTGSLVIYKQDDPGKMRFCLYAERCDGLCIASCM